MLDIGFMNAHKFVHAFHCYKSKSKRDKKATRARGTKTLELQNIYMMAYIV